MNGLIKAMRAKAEHWRHEARYLDIAKAVGDECTSEFAQDALETASLLDQAADLLEIDP